MRFALLADSLVELEVVLMVVVESGGLEDGCGGGLGFFGVGQFWLSDFFVFGLFAERGGCLHGQDVPLREYLPG